MNMEHVQKIVAAAMKVMYSEQARGLLKKTVQAASDPKALAQEAVGIIKILFDKSQGKMPPDAIPVAAMMIIYEIASFASEATGKKIPPEVVKQAVPIAMQMLKKVFAAQIEQAKRGAPAAPAQQAPQQPPQPPRGMINQPQMAGA